MEKERSRGRLLTLVTLFFASSIGAHPSSDVIQVIRQTDLAPGPGTPGITRDIAFENEGVTAVLAQTDPGVSSTWHTHLDHDVYGYVVSGSVRFDYGDASITVGPGEFFHVPPRTVHREFNPSTDQKGRIVLFITGSGPLVENVDEQ